MTLEFAEPRPMPRARFLSRRWFGAFRLGNALAYQGAHLPTTPLPAPHPDDLSPHGPKAWVSWHPIMGEVPDLPPGHHELRGQPGCSGLAPRPAAE